ncbi:MAG TPA: hypothetical protein VHN77_12125 [Phycisphaerales bacterium]|nr:hypothetical protein [Phycisphaerales bacterium]
MDELRVLAKVEFPKEAEHLGIDIDVCGYARFDPVVWCECDGIEVECEGVRVVSERPVRVWRSPVRMYQSLIEPVTVCSDDMKSECGISDEDWGYFKLVELECLCFIRECWLNAGGEHVTVLATTQEHDSGWMLNLKTGEWEPM